MVKTKKSAIELEIKEFKQNFFNKHGVKVCVYSLSKRNDIQSVEVFLKCALIALHKHKPRFKDITSMSHKLRQRDFLVYLQAVSYLAWEEGHSKKAVSIHVERTHATVINSINQIENGISVGDVLIVNTINNILIELQNYVGNISNNIQEQTDTQSISNTVRYEDEGGVA
tara:strand:+ start:3460 stop:3969 length:510 start_codon:yes stop_codon:yes gene_type:complete